MGGLQRDGDVLVLRLAPEERSDLASCAASLIEMLEPDEDPNRDPDPLARIVGISGDSPVDRPDDPALRRLLPDAYEDADGAAEFRRLTDADLRTEKVANLRRLLAGATATGGVVRIGPDEVDAWLAALTDIRLVLAERLDLTEDHDHLPQFEPEDPRLPLLLAYLWLSELQDWMLELLVGD